MPQMIDTLKLFDSLKKSFTEEQAHLLSHLISLVREEASEEVLATKKDIKELEFATKKDIAETNSNLELKIAEVKILIAQSKAEILKWMVGFLLAQTGIIAALVKLL